MTFRVTFAVDFASVGPQIELRGVPSLVDVPHKVPLYHVAQQKWVDTRIITRPLDREERHSEVVGVHLPPEGQHTVVIYPAPNKIVEAVQLVIGGLGLPTPFVRDLSKPSVKKLRDRRSSASPAVYLPIVSK